MADPLPKVGGHLSILQPCTVVGHRAQDETHLPLQVLLTGKPCRNFQVPVAYSLLQLVREQVLQESMAGDDILLVRAPSGQACPTAGWRPRLGRAGLRCPLEPWAGVVMGADTHVLSTAPSAL